MGRVLVVVVFVAVAVPTGAHANHLGIERRIADELYAWTNVEREARGIPAVVRDPRLDAFAGGWSDHMSRTGAFVHREVLDGVIDLGYGSAGENIASVIGDRRRAIELHLGWWGRDGHRRNMLEPTFRAIGFGVSCAVRRGNLTVFAVANFGGDVPEGDRRPVPALDPQAARGPGTASTGCLRALGVPERTPPPPPTPAATPSSAPEPTLTPTPRDAILVKTGDAEPMREPGRVAWFFAAAVVLVGAAFVFGRMRRASGG